jgi:hypothetical protein
MRTLILSSYSSILIQSYTECHMSHLIYNKILINFLKEKKLKIIKNLKSKLKKKKKWVAGHPVEPRGGRDRPVWGGRTTPNNPQGPKKIKINFFLKKTRVADEPIGGGRPPS